MCAGETALWVMLAVQGQRPGFDFQNPVKNFGINKKHKNFGIVEHICNPVTGKVEMGGLAS